MSNVDDEWCAEEAATRVYRAVCAEIAAWPAAESMDPLLGALRQLVLKVEKIERGER